MDFSNKCRMCLSIKDHQNLTNIMKHCYLGKSFKCVILMLVPTVDKTLLAAEHCVCENCAETLKRSVVLIHNCLVLEEHLKRLQLQNNKQKDPSKTMCVVNNIQSKDVMVNENDKEKSAAVNLKISNEKEKCIVIDLTTADSCDISQPQDNQTATEIHVNNDKKLVNKDHSYCTSSISEKDTAKLDKIDNRIISLNPSNVVILEKQVACLIENGIYVNDTSANNTGSKDTGNKRKRILLIGSNVPTQCPECFKSLKFDRYHVCRKKRKRVPKPLVKCPICNKGINTGFMNSHLRKHEQDEYREIERQKQKQAKRLENFTCQTCSERFPSKEEFEFHLELHPPHVCEVCGKSYAKKMSLKAHMVTHNEPNSFICEVCGKGYKDRSCLRTHLQLHEDKSFKCNLCPKVFKQNTRLTRHKNQVHHKIFRSQCTQCGKMFMNEGSLNSHVKLVHFKEKPFECHICQTKFGRADYLQNHLTRHTGERTGKNSGTSKKLGTRRRRKKLNYALNDNGQPVPCKFCGTWQRDMMTLRRHLETHFTRYQCKFCPLTFARKALCKRHEQVLHEGVRSDFFRCNVCWKKLTSKEALDEHVKRHNKPRHFCDICGKPFNRKFLMNHHKLMEHCDIPDMDHAEEIIFDSLMEVSRDMNATEQTN